MAELSRNEIIGQKLTGNAKIQKMSGIWICQDLGGSCELRNLDFWMTLHLQKPFLERPENSTQFKIMIWSYWSDQYMFINVCTTFKMTCGIKIWISKAKFFLVGKFYWYRLHYFLSRYIIRQGGVGLALQKSIKIHSVKKFWLCLIHTSTKFNSDQIL